MLPRAMPARRPILAALAFVLAVLVVAVVGCGEDVLTFTVCGTPTLTEKAADGGPDPCHCDPPASLGIMSCGCRSDPADQQAIDDCPAGTALVHVEEDGGDGTGGAP